MSDTPRTDAMFREAGMYVGEGDESTQHGKLKRAVRQLERELEALKIDQAALEDLLKAEQRP